MKKYILIILILVVFTSFVAGDDFVLVQGGTFLMGSMDGDSDEVPSHGVTVSSFYIGTYEVTQGDYEALIDENPSSSGYGIGENHPVNDISWYEALEYCNALSKKEGLSPSYSGSGANIECDFNANGYRLPTEAEWEYAATGGVSTSSSTYAGSNNIDEVGWYKKNSDKTTFPVGSKQKNELGLYDMTGNVFEWCWDWYGDYPYERQNDPTGKPLGEVRVFRGGSMISTAAGSRSTFRSASEPSINRFFVGLRLVRNL